MGWAVGYGPRGIEVALAEPEPPPPVPVPAGYQLLREYDLSIDEGWTLETGKPSNADGYDRPANVTFGQGPDGTSMQILGSRDVPGGTFYTGDAKGYFQNIPNYHRSRAVVEFDTFTVGMWPAVWKRPQSGEGEIDDWEKFGGNGPPFNSWYIDAGTLHTTPYDATHKKVNREFPTFGPGRHVIETELKAGLFTWWVDTTFSTTVSAAQFDTAAGRSAWAPMFGNAAKNWYFRMTLQAGGTDGGPIPASLMSWRFWIHELAVYVPV